MSFIMLKLVPHENQTWYKVDFWFDDFFNIKKVSVLVWHFRYFFGGVLLYMFYPWEDFYLFFSAIGADLL